MHNFLMFMVSVIIITMSEHNNQPRRFNCFLALESLPPT